MQQIFNINTIKLIAGLGNIGKEYTQTRHNAGFMFTEKLADSNFKLEEKFKAEIAELNFVDSGQKIILAKPVTLMNLSGFSVRAIASFYKINPEEILVAHDDLDIPIGKVKVHFGKGPYAHNGVTDVENKLSTKDFWRLRIGVENRDTEQKRFISGKDYVLGKLSKNEVEKIENSLDNAIDQHFFTTP